MATKKPTALTKVETSNGVQKVADYLDKFQDVDYFKGLDAKVLGAALAETSKEDQVLSLRLLESLLPAGADESTDATKVTDDFMADLGLDLESLQDEYGIEKRVTNFVKHPIPLVKMAQALTAKKGSKFNPGDYIERVNHAPIGSVHNVDTPERFHEVRFRVLSIYNTRALFKQGDSSAPVCSSENTQLAQNGRPCKICTLQPRSYNQRVPGVTYCKSSWNIVMVSEDLTTLVRIPVGGMAFKKAMTLEKSLLSASRQLNLPIYSFPVILSAEEKEIVEEQKRWVEPTFRVLADKPSDANNGIFRLLTETISAYKVTDIESLKEKAREFVGAGKHEKDPFGVAIKGAQTQTNGGSRQTQSIGLGADTLSAAKPQTEKSDNNVDVNDL